MEFSREINSSSCFDSENPSAVSGWYQDKFTKGTIKIVYENNNGIIKEETVIDECTDNGLVDYSCSPIGDGNFVVGFGNYIECPNGCQEGRCI